MLFISRDELSSLVTEIRSDPRRTLAQLLRLSGDFSIDDLFVPEFEDGLLDKDFKLDWLYLDRSTDLRPRYRFITSMKSIKFRNLKIIIVFSLD